MSTLEMMDSELYEAGIAVLTDKLGAAEVPRFIRQCRPGTGNYSVDRHKLLADQPGVETHVKRMQQHRTTKEAEEKARSRRFTASQSEIQEMTDLEIYEIGCEILIQKLGVAGSMRFLLQCQQRNGDCPDYLPQSRADAEEDIRFYTALLTLNPKMVEDYIKRGNAYCYIGEYTKAIADYSAAIARKPNHLKAYYRRGVAYAKNTEYAKAISDYNEVIQRAPKQAEVYQRRGEAWYRLKEQEKANADLRVAKKLRKTMI